MKLDGRNALITGAGSGMGRATALLFAREGAKVAAIDIDEGAAVKTATQIAVSYTHLTLPTICSV